MKKKVKVLVKCPLGDVGEEYKFDTSGVWINGFIGYLGKQHIEKWIEDGWLELITEPERLEDLYNEYSGRLIEAVDSDVKYVKNEKAIKHLVDLAQMRIDKIFDEDLNHMKAHGERLKILNEMKEALKEL